MFQHQTSYSYVQIRISYSIYSNQKYKTSPIIFQNHVNSYRSMNESYLRVKTKSNQISDSKNNNLAQQKPVQQ